MFLEEIDHSNDETLSFKDHLDPKGYKNHPIRSTKSFKTGIGAHSTPYSTMTSSLSENQDFMEDPQYICSISQWRVMMSRVCGRKHNRCMSSFEIQVLLTTRVDTQYEESKCNADLPLGKINTASLYSLISMEEASKADQYSQKPSSPNCLEDQS